MPSKLTKVQGQLDDKDSQAAALQQSQANMQAKLAGQQVLLKQLQHSLAEASSER